MEIIEEWRRNWYYRILKKARWDIASACQASGYQVEFAHQQMLPSQTAAGAFVRTIISKQTGNSERGREISLCSATNQRPQPADILIVHSESGLQMGGGTCPYAPPGSATAL
ncbi:hypothetical protein LSTR_LSTR012348 [Laodelphax striatellus]|uniref:Uncharacterized protein n=1 Tax=Laodelphax striatellus TaxID=195883 RepID=A0A482WKJ3_LAOST|nr:hypothetical protein LSTR_LSTR012348 [Laodelphax striatellus]